jgi:hypothetical protein
VAPPAARRRRDPGPTAAGGSGGGGGRRSRATEALRLARASGHDGGPGPGPAPGTMLSGRSSLVRPGGPTRNYYSQLSSESVRSHHRDRDRDWHNHDSSTVTQYSPPAGTVTVTVTRIQARTPSPLPSHSVWHAADSGGLGGTTSMPVIRVLTCRLPVAAVPLAVPVTRSPGLYHDQSRSLGVST